jgi:hypothetical protein
MFKEPELTFQNWEETVEVQPGKNVVIKARPYNIYDLVYRTKKLADDTVKMTLKDGKGNVSKTVDATFTDRKGVRVSVSIAITGNCNLNSASVSIKVAYNGKEKLIALSCDPKETKESLETIEKIDCEFTIDYRYGNYASIEYLIERNDISTDEYESE